MRFRGPGRLQCILCINSFIYYFDLLTVIYCNSLWAIIYVFRSCHSNRLFFMLLNNLQDSVQFDFLSWKSCYTFASWEIICWHLFERARFPVTLGSWSLPDLAQGKRKFGCHHTDSPSFTPFPVLFIRADLSFSLVSYTFA